jgi:hypothetical protein
VTVCSCVLDAIISMKLSLVVRLEMIFGRRGRDKFSRRACSPIPSDHFGKAASKLAG